MFVPVVKSSPAPESWLEASVYGGGPEMAGHVDVTVV